MYVGSLAEVSVNSIVERTGAHREGESWLPLKQTRCKKMLPITTLE